MNKNQPLTKYIFQPGLVARQLRILASQFRVLRTGTRSEIRPDNMYQPLQAILNSESDQYEYKLKLWRTFF